MSDQPDILARIADQLRRNEVGEARKAAAAAIAAGGDHPSLFQAAGVAACRAGDFAVGIEYFEQALARAPRNPGLLLMLMRAEIDAGRPRSALARPFGIEGWPTGAILALWRSRAEAAFSVGDVPLEAEALDRIIAIDPADKEGIERRQQIASIMASSEGALRLAESLPSSRRRERARAAALIELNRFREAAEIDLAQLLGNPADDDAWLSIVLLADRLHDRALLDQILVLGQARPVAQSNFVRAVIAKQDGNLEQALALAQSSEVPGNEVRRFALIAKLADRVGRADMAIGAARAMSAATPDRVYWRQRAADHRAELRRRAAMTTAENLESWSAALPISRQTPIFLVGFPRSGTTLLDTFLRGHSCISVVEEQPMLDAAAAVLGPEEGFGTLTNDTIAAARQAYFTELDRHLPEASNPDVVIDKLPLALTGMATIKRLLPDARFIFAQRHPADVVISNFIQHFRLNDGMANFLDLHDAAEFYDAAMVTWSAGREAFKPDIHTMVYEALVEDPEAHLRSLVGWLGLEWEEALLDHRQTAKARSAIITPSYDQVIEKIHTRSSGRWQEYLHHVRDLAPLLDPWATAMGYDTIESRALASPKTR